MVGHNFLLSFLIQELTEVIHYEEADAERAGKEAVREV